MVAQSKAVFLGYRLLALFYDFIVKLLDSPAVNTNDVIMMQASFQLKNSLAAFEMVPRDKSCRFKLGKGPVNRGQPDFLTRLQQFAIDRFGRQMAVLNILQKLKHLKPRQGGFQTCILKMFRLVHSMAPQNLLASCQKSVAIANENDYHSLKSLGFCHEALVDFRLASSVCRERDYVKVLTNFIIRGGAVLARNLLTCILVATMPSFAFAAAPLPVLSIHDSQFEPKQLTLTSGVKLKLVIRNLDEMPAEFESSDLSREVIVPGHGEVTIYVGPLDPGNYQFFNDFNHEMQGTIVAMPAVKKEN